jgi:hypothetical protein
MAAVPNRHLFCNTVESCKTFTWSAALLLLLLLLLPGVEPWCCTLLVE